MHKRPLYLMAVGALTLGAVSCSDNDRSLTTSDSVERIAASTSETAAPFSINNGAFVFNDTSETAEPIRINQ